MRRIPLTECTYDSAEIDAAIEVLRSGHITMGERCAEFERRFAAYVGSRNAVFVNSGSSANLLAFFALANPLWKDPRGRRGIHAGAEVIVPAVTWSTTIWPMVQAGAVPVLVDTDPRTLQINVDQVRGAISPRTVGICPVHVLGNASPMAPLRQLADDHGLWLVEDACEALGTRHDGRQVGTGGDLGTYSFYFSHQLTTIEGGMLVTDDDDLADLVRCLRAHGWTRDMRHRAAVEAEHPEIDPRFMFVNTGFNLRPTEINAAFGLQQLRKLDAFNARRRAIATEWNTEFAGLVARGDLSLMEPTAGTDCTWFGYPVLCRTPAAARGLRAHLERSGVETRPIICGNLARQPAFKLIAHRVHGDLPGADAIMFRGLYWGAHPGMPPEDVKHVTDAVRGFFQ